MADGSLPAVDLTNCDREPIHIPGLIQPFGFLVALHRRLARLARLGQCRRPYRPRTGGDARPADQHAVRRGSDPHDPQPHDDAARRRCGRARVRRRADRGRGRFDVAVHFSGDHRDPRRPNRPATAMRSRRPRLVRAMIARLGQTEGLTAFFREGARQVRALTGFDRVMVYRFDHDGAGEVIAETVRPGLGSFLGLNYPASDIPAQARTLYLRNIFRVIADVASTPVPIVPALDPRGAAARPLARGAARGLADPHRISRATWASARRCRSRSSSKGGCGGCSPATIIRPRLPGVAHRGAAELFGQMFSMMLESRERREVADYETRARGVADRLMAAVAQDAGAARRRGVARRDGRRTRSRATASASISMARCRCRGLPRRRAAVRGDRDARSTRSQQARCSPPIRSPRSCPRASAYADRAAGLVAIPLSRCPRDYVVLFRSERLRSVRWAGNPEKPIELGPNGPRLTPRKSFEEWSELVKGKATPFTAAELRVAETLRTALLEVVLRLSDSASQRSPQGARAAGIADRRTQPPRPQHPLADPWADLADARLRAEPRGVRLDARRSHPGARPRARSDHQRPLGAGAADRPDRDRGRRLPRREARAGEAERAERADRGRRLHHARAGRSTNCSPTPPNMARWSMAAPSRSTGRSIPRRDRC